MKDLAFDSVVRRATLLGVCLTLSILSFVPLSAPVAAQQQLPAAFGGGWQGTMVVRNPDSQFPFSLNLTGGSVGSIVGTVDYPAGPVRTFPCRGNLVLRGVSADGSRVDLVEKLTEGQAYCTFYDANITLALQADGSLAYQWSHPAFGGTATATLTRSGAAPGQTTITPPRADWCADLATTYGPAPPLSGPWRGTLEQRQGNLTRADGGVSVTDFVATVLFSNPTTSTTVPWEYGFAFRQTADQAEVQQIFIDSNGGWYYASYPQGVLASGEAPSFNFSPGASNALDLVVEGDTASFCLNGQFVNTVQLPPAVASDVYLVTGFFDTTIVTGRLVAYDGFAVWALPATTAQQVPSTTCQWTGTWDTEFGPLRLTQSGDTVSGDYDWDQGQISGTVSGNVLRGTWNEAPSRQPPTDAGEVALTMRDDCQSFTGQWRYGSSEPWRTGWFGQRVSN